MTTERLYQAPIAPAATLLNSLTAPARFDEWYDYLLSRPEPFERICLDRYIFILNRLLHRRLFDCSILDLGCSSGFFASAYALAIASQVTAVEDARAREFGYSPQAFLSPLRDFTEAHGLQHVEIVDAAIEGFLGTAAGTRQWDVVLCLSVLHHYHTGYGDRTEVGSLRPAEIQTVYRDLGAVTRHVLFLEVDSTRIANQEQFFSDLCDLGGYAAPTLVGWSCSAPGVRRALWELTKRDD